mgnify:CR=1 FL=1
MKFGIVTDSSCDLPESYTMKEDVTVVSFYVSFDGENYLKEGKEAGITEFYQKMADKFLPLVKQGLPVLCICLTKNFSGSMQAAVSAKEEVEEEFPQAKTEVVNSQLVTALQGLFVKEAVKLRNQDVDLETAVEALKKIRHTGQIFFTTKDLKYLEHGGRIGKAACLAGSMLNIKPILRFCDAELGSTELCRESRSNDWCTYRPLSYGTGNFEKM